MARLSVNHTFKSTSSDHERSECSFCVRIVCDVYKNDERMNDKFE